MASGSDACVISCHSVCVCTRQPVYESGTSEAAWFSLPASRPPYTHACMHMPFGLLLPAVLHGPCHRYGRNTHVHHVRQILPLALFATSFSNSPSSRVPSISIGCSSGRAVSFHSPSLPTLPPQCLPEYPHARSSTSPSPTPRRRAPPLQQHRAPAASRRRPRRGSPASARCTPLRLGQAGV